MKLFGVPHFWTDFALSETIFLILRQAKLETSRPALDDAGDPFRERWLTGWG